MEENEVNLLTWPGSSPDLNLIENLWRQLRTLKSTSVQQPQPMMQAIWLEITAKKC